jgi:hypothetical protein
MIARPKTTNVVSAGIIGFGGDVVAQSLEQRASSSSVASPRAPISLARAGKVAVWTALFAGPFTVWFKFLDGRFPTPAAGAAALGTRLQSVACKVLCNQVVAAPINNGGFYAWIIACQAVDKQLAGRGAAPPSGSEEAGETVTAQIATKLREDLPRTMANSVLVWGSAWTVSILYMPPHTRTLFNSVGQVFWVAYLSLIGHKRNV